MLSAVALFALAFAAERAVAQKKYDPGATDSEIKIGNIMPYSGRSRNMGQSGAPRRLTFT
jgi:hypothetical protein